MSVADEPPEGGPRPDTDPRAAGDAGGGQVGGRGAWDLDREQNRAEDGDAVEANGARHHRGEDGPEAVAEEESPAPDPPRTLRQWVARSAPAAPWLAHLAALLPVLASTPAVAAADAAAALAAGLAARRGGVVPLAWAATLGVAVAAPARLLGPGLTAAMALLVLAAVLAPKRWRAAAGAGALFHPALGALGASAFNTRTAWVALAAAAPLAALVHGTGAAAAVAAGVAVAAGAEALRRRVLLTARTLTGAAAWSVRGAGLGLLVLPAPLALAGVAGHREAGLVIAGAAALALVQILAGLITRRTGAEAGFGLAAVAALATAAALWPGPHSVRAALAVAWVLGLVQLPLVLARVVRAAGPVAWLVGAGVAAALGMMLRGLA